MSFPLSQLHPVTPPDPLDPKDLVALVSSRICHDLVNPLSAISNGVELVGMSPEGATGPEFDLIRDSVENANARVMFFRIAFGAAGEDDALDAAEVEATILCLSKGLRQSIDWAAHGRHSRIDVKLSFLLILCLETALPYGGTIKVSRSGPNWVIRGQAERFADVAHLWRIITHADPAGDLTAAQVHFALAASEQDAQRKRIDLVESPTSITLTVRPA